MAIDPFAKKMIQGGLIFAGVLLIIIAVFTVVYLHLRPQCVDEVASESASPNRQWIATIMQRRCGEETPFVTHVNLRSAGHAIRYGFFSGRAEEGEILSVEQEVQALHLALVWNSPDHLTIHCRDCANASKRQVRWNSVFIRYE
ncbi:MAG TPA: hypothetical protein VG649_11475 [Candidatus Angelobacter sp.]|nr:hypothetical protein [Candidatus Angelobacter sp.]